MILAQLDADEREREKKSRKKFPKPFKMAVSLLVDA